MADVTVGQQESKGVVLSYHQFPKPDENTCKYAQGFLLGQCDLVNEV